MFYGVNIDGVDTLSEYGLILLSDVVIPSPPLKETRIDVPGRDGTVDLSYAVSGEPIFGNRDITFTLFKSVNDEGLSDIKQQLSEFHGRQVRLTFPFDREHYYTGTFKMGSHSGYNSGKIPVTFTADPYKISHNLTQSDYLLDSEIDGKAFTLGQMPTILTITASCDAQLTYQGVAYSLEAGAAFNFPQKLRHRTEIFYWQATGENVSNQRINFSYRKGEL